MKNAMESIKSAWNENPSEVIGGIIFCISWFATIYGLLWLGSILGLS